MDEINASLQKLLSGNEKCDDDTNDDAAAAAADNNDDDADGQHDPYMSAMLRQRHRSYASDACLVLNLISEVRVCAIISCN